MEDVHPKLYPVPCLPLSLHTNTNYDQDFKVIFFYLIDKPEFRRAILSDDRSCFYPRKGYKNVNAIIKCGI